jgi:hypothetical protein
VIAKFTFLDQAGKKFLPQPLLLDRPVNHIPETGRQQ